MSPQTERALQIATARKAAQTELRRRVRDGEVRLAELLIDPPEEVQNMTLLDLVRMRRNAGGTKATAGLQKLGRMAVRDQVNLLCPVGQASVRSRAWVARHADWNVKRGDGRLRLRITETEVAA